MIKSNNLTQYDGNWQGKTSLNSNIINLSSKSNDDSESTDLKWWGDLVILILCVLLIALGVIFFISAFNNVGKPKVIKDAQGAVNKVKKAVKK